MDVLFFLSQRIGFIRQLYGTASAPYVERKRKIEAGEEPFVPPYSEDEEPPFLEEWLEADESLHVLAYSCVSMLAAALHLYLETWVKQSGIPVDKSLKKSVFKKSGWFAGYRAHFAQHFKIDFETGPANLGMLEEVILARNRIEHPSSITSRRTQYADADVKKLRHPFFLRTQMKEKSCGSSLPPCTLSKNSYLLQSLKWNASPSGSKVQLKPKSMQGKLPNPSVKRTACKLCLQVPFALLKGGRESTTWFDRGL